MTLSRFPMWYAILEAAIICTPLLVPSLGPAECYVRRDTWQETMLASQEELARRCQQSVEQNAALVQVSPWYMTDPIDDVLAEERSASRKFSMEPFESGTAAEIHFLAGVDLEAKGQEGKPVWNPRPDLVDGPLHHLAENRYTSIYLYRRLIVPTACKVTVAFRAEGHFVTPTLQAWLNGRELLIGSPDFDRYLYRETEVQLEPGVNHLLVRVHHLWSFGFRVLPHPLSIASCFLYQLQRDFSDPGDLREIEREIDEGIWDGPLGMTRSRNLAELATRYARACDGRGYADQATQLSITVQTIADLDQVRQVYHRRRDFEDYWQRIAAFDFHLLDSTCSQVLQLRTESPDQYPVAEMDYPAQLLRLQREQGRIRTALENGQEDRLALEQIVTLSQTLNALRWYALRARIGTEQIIFAARKKSRGYNWFGDMSYFQNAPSCKMYCEGGSQLCLLNLRTGEAENLLGDPDGAVRDPHVNYDGDTILFSWRKSGTEYYHLYEMELGNRNPRQLTSGPYDDIEAIYLPDGGIMFNSTRCNRWVACGTYRVAILHRCERDGSNIRALSSNIVHDGTPWMLPDGRVLYTRWEYVDRNQMRYQHLWTANPDGTGVSVYYGNQFPNNVFIDAKPIPGTDRVVYVELLNHGSEDHTGMLMVVAPHTGPDDRSASQPLDLGPDFPSRWSYRDPYPVAQDTVLFASQQALYVTDGQGDTQLVYALPDNSHPNLTIQEPRPVRSRPREPIIPTGIDLSKATGRLALIDVTYGRNMEGVKRGEIKKLLVLEQLPKPVNTIPVSLGGTFTLKRILGTVPVEADGSAYFEVPALRSLFFVALDEQNMSVKRMQSFVTLQPGEFTSCAGCHEKRTVTAGRPQSGVALALRRLASRIEPIANIPPILDFPRDIQPILDRHCVACHDYEATAQGGPYAGRVILTGDVGFSFSHSFVHLTIHKQFSDARNGHGNVPPRSIGTSASPLMRKISGSHYGVKLNDRETDMVRCWIEAGANYAGTYAAAGSDFLAYDARWPKDFCLKCHVNQSSYLHSEGIYNLSRPETSLALLAPLAEEAGGWGVCRDKSGKPVFTTREDPLYRQIAECLQWASEQRVATNVPQECYFHELRIYGVLPSSFDPRSDSFDVHELDERYFRSFWH